MMERGAGRCPFLVAHGSTGRHRAARSLPRLASGTACGPVTPHIDVGHQSTYTVCMEQLQFEWDERKAADNLRKHGISFDEAATVFSDDTALFMADPDHSGDEERFLILGLSSQLRTVVVCHCYRESEEVIRIISARKATRGEREQYAGRWKK